MPEKASENINIRSDDVQDVLGQIPSWIIRWGITLVVITVLLFILGSWLFNYPDIKRADVLVTTENPPATLIARSSGQLEALFVKDNQVVQSGMNLAVIENPANYEHVIWLDEITKEIRQIFPNFDIIITLELRTDYTLGELQPAYARFLKAHKDYQNFVELDYYNQKIKSLQAELSKQQVHLKSLKQLSNILKRELDLVTRQFDRDSMLHLQNVIPVADYEKSKSNMLNKEFEYEQSRIEETSTEIQVVQLDQDVLDLELRSAEDTKQQQNGWQEALENLIAEIALWKQKYLLVAPIDGVVTFTAYWSENQNVRVGDKVMTVIPAEQGEIIGKINLPVEGAGKVKVGQQVNIKFKNFPHLEYGMVKGIIRNISLVPDNSYYMVEVNMPDGLTTYYGISIPFNQEMQGTAEIITDNRRLLERIISPIRSAISKQRATT